MRRTNHRNLVNVGILSGRIPLISLVQFIAVAEHLNFRHAAKALGISGTVAKLAMRQPFVLFKGLTFQKLCLPGAFRPG
ncbi:LysR family transcriptional regulator, partial [Escherichia coli]|nr:LysR family transcriptional regulator [Escherichia coli]